VIETWLTVLHKKEKYPQNILKKFARHTCRMAITNISVKSEQRKCIMCEGSLEKSNMGMICNDCRDKMRK